MNDIKKSKTISGEAYIQSFNANAHVLLNLLISWLVFIIPGELVSDDCICRTPNENEFKTHTHGYNLNFNNQ